MIPTKKIWFNGKFLGWDGVNVHILTHALHYGSSIFEGIRCYTSKDGYIVFRLDDHIRRFMYSAKCLEMPIKFTLPEIKKSITDLVRINKAGDSYIRPIAFSGYGKMGLSPIGAPTNIAITSWRWDIEKTGEKGIAAKISPFMRIHPGSVDIKAKIGGYYANSILASNDARKSGFSEAILLDYRGYVAEGTGDNIFMVKDKKLYTPLPQNILPGITRDSIMKIARDSGIKVIEKNIKPGEIKNADEVFLTGTAIEVWPVLRIDNRRIGDGRAGDTTALLKEEYGKIIRGENKKYSKWLTHIK